MDLQNLFQLCLMYQKCSGSESLCSMQNFKIAIECSNAMQLRIALTLLTPVHTLSE